MLFSIAFLTGLAASIAMPKASAANDPRFTKRSPLVPRASSGDPYSTEYYFDQLIDHNNPSLGTFKQRYFFSDQYYTGQGAPIVFGTPGEQSADGFYTDLTGDSIMRSMMQTLGAGGIMLEHRYWGQSSPYQNLTAPNLQYLTVQQAIDDSKYFMENVKLSWAKGSYTSDPTVTPWVNVGCSYPGLLVAYTQEKYPDLFAAGYATSAPVNADGDFWEYYEPIEEGMPKNCSTDLAAAVAYIDNIMATGSEADVLAMKTKFGFEALANDDFASALIYPLGTWQDLQAYTFATDGYPVFYQFCDAIETKADGTYNTAEQGVGLPLALENWAAVIKQALPDSDCPGTGGACYATNDPTSIMYTDTSVSDTYQRAWIWLMCTQLGFFQVGDPGNSSSIVSNQVTNAYNERRCSYYFPLADGTHSTYNFSQAASDMNTQFKGWNVVGQNIVVNNGEFDPWRSASLSSKWAPFFTDTPTQEITVIPNGHHCWDFYLANGQVDPEVKKVQQDSLAEIHQYVQNWYTAHPSVSNSMPSFSSVSDAALAADGSNTADVDGSNDTGINELKSKIDELMENKKLALASYITNGVLVLLLLLCMVLLVLEKRKRSGGGKSPKWQRSKEAGGFDGDQLGEYGSGGMAGGRGKYQQLKEQHV